jgi:hypothetical protein
MRDLRDGMTPGQRAAFDELMGMPAPRWPGLLASYVRGTPVSALGYVAAEMVKTVPAEIMAAWLDWGPSRSAALANGRRD